MNENAVNTQSEPERTRLVIVGGLLGLLSGLTGVGGGVFLTPALLAMRVAPVKPSCCNIGHVYCGQLSSRACRVGVRRKYATKYCSRVSRCSWCRWAGWFSSRSISLYAANTAGMHRVRPCSRRREIIVSRYVGVWRVASRCLKMPKMIIAPRPRSVVKAT